MKTGHVWLRHAVPLLQTSHEPPDLWTLRPVPLLQGKPLAKQRVPSVLAEPRVVRRKAAAVRVAPTETALQLVHSARQWCVHPLTHTPVHIEEGSHPTS